MLRTMPPGGLARPVRMMTAASAPPEAVLTAATAAGLYVGSTLSQQSRIYDAQHDLIGLQSGGHEVLLCCIVDWG